MVDSQGFTPPSPDRCPDCGGLLSGKRCRDCGLNLVGPMAAGLWAVDVELHRLWGEHRRLIGALRAGAPDLSTPPHPLEWTPAPPPPAPWAPAGVIPASDAAWQSVPVSQSREFASEPGSPPLQIQNVLLGLGAFSLIVAAVVFIAVTWRELSSPGKALTLAGLTTVFAVVTTLLRRRSLTATAEALSAVTVMLGLADAYAVRVGLLSGTETLVVWGVAFGVLAVVDAAFAALSRTTLPRLAAAVLAQLCLPVLALGLSSSESVLYAVLFGQALALAAALRWAPFEPGRLVASITRAGGVVAWMVATGGATVLALTGESGRFVPAALLAGAAGVAVAMAWWRPAEEEGGRLMGAAVATAALLGSGATFASHWLSGEELALGTVALAVAFVVAAAWFDRPWRGGPIVVAGVGAIGVSAPSWPLLISTVTAPWLELVQTGAWELAADRSARTVGLDVDVLGVGFGTALVFLSLLAIGGLGLRRLRVSRRAADGFLALLIGTAATVVPFAVDSTVWAAAVLLLSMATFLAALMLWRVADGVPRSGLTLGWALSIAVGTEGLAWSLLTPGTTLGGLVMVAAVAGAVTTLGIRRSDPRVAFWGTLAMSVATASAVPVAGRVLGAQPEVGWTALGVLAGPAAAAGCIAWSRFADRARESAAMIAGVVAGLAYSTAVIGVSPLVGHASGAAGMLAAMLGTGAIAALVVTTAMADREDSISAVAAVLGTLLAVAAAAMVGVQMDLSPSAVWLVALAGSAVAALAAMVAQAAHAPRDVVDAVDTGAAMGGTLGLLGLVSEGSGDRISAGLLLVTLALAVVSTRPDRRPAAWMAAVVALALVWQRLALAGVSTAEAFTLPAAALLAAVGVWRHQQDPDQSSWNTWAPALLVALGPSVLLSLGDPGLARPVATVVAATAVLLLGSHLRRQAPVTIGAAALTALGAEQLGPVVQQLPRWITFATVGTVLLIVGASYERRRAQLDIIRSHYRSLE